jgi:hypothetical protein
MPPARRRIRGTEDIRSVHINSSSFVTRVCVCVTVLLASINISAAQTGSVGVVLESSPVYLYPDATRTPLATLAAGTQVRIVETRGDWSRVEFRDPVFGPRVAYIATSRIRVQPATAGPQKPGQPQPPQPGGPTRRPIPQRRPVQPPVTQRGLVSINGGVQTTSRAFAGTSTFTTFVESGSITSQYDSDQPFVVDISGAAGAWRSLGMGVGVSYSSTPLAGAVEAQIPHPFFFNKLRTVTGSAPELTREEIALHLDARWVFRLGRAASATVFGGPSYFRVTQGLVTDIKVTEEYPFDTAAFQSVTIADSEQSKWGFNAGFDVTQRVAGRFGVGVLGRYSRASFEFPIVGEHTAEIEAGGFQLGAGLRIVF